MTELELPIIKKSPRIRPWRYIPILIILGLAAYLLLPQIASLKSSWSVIMVPNAVSVVVILGYRLFSFWLPTLLGFVAAAYLCGRFPGLKRKRA